MLAAPHLLTSCVSICRYIAYQMIAEHKKFNREVRKFLDDYDVSCKCSALPKWTTLTYID